MELENEMLKKQIRMQNEEIKMIQMQKELFEENKQLFTPEQQMNSAEQIKEDFIAMRKKQHDDFTKLMTMLSMRGKANEHANK
jgi:hypothetical protein